MGGGNVTVADALSPVEVVSPALCAWAALASHNISATIQKTHIAHSALLIFSSFANF